LGLCKQFVLTVNPGGGVCDGYCLLHSAEPTAGGEPVVVVADARDPKGGTDPGPGRGQSAVRSIGSSNSSPRRCLPTTYIPQVDRE